MDVQFFAIESHTHILARVYDAGAYHFYRVQFCNNGETPNICVGSYRMIVDPVGETYANLVLQGNIIGAIDNPATNMVFAVATIHARKGE
jgi:hypothetical protein